MHYTNLNAPMVRADITLFCEVVMPPALSLSRENWLMPNCEWWDPRNDRFLNHFTKILCKTQDCYRIWTAKVGPQKCVYTSFEGRDIYKPEIERELRFLHVAGKSEHKNTEAVIKAWRSTQRVPFPHLTIISRAPAFQDELKTSNWPYKNVTHIEQATDDVVINLMNNCQCHIMPSMYEGFGHALQEGIGCGALMFTTNAAPMNAFEGIYRPGLIPVQSTIKRSLADMSMVHGAQVNLVVNTFMNRWYMNRDAAKDSIKSCSEEARAGFLRNREFFRATFMGLVNSVKR
jgi:hypothetical protein